MGMLEDVGIGRKNFALSDRSIFRVLDAFGQIRPIREHIQVSAMSRAQTEVAFAAQSLASGVAIPENLKLALSRNLVLLGKFF